MSRLRRIHDLIRLRATGKAASLASRLSISRATLERDLQFLREYYRAPIAYDRKRECYYYTVPFDLDFNALAA